VAHVQVLHEGGYLTPHIPARRLWDYLNFKIQLKEAELEHLSSCAECLELFNNCVMAESPDKLQALAEDAARKKSA